MEYVQMTLSDWVQMKQKLKQELLGVKQSFVRIGYALRKIEEQKLYEQDGYKSIAEFAKAEYGLESSTISRFMSINREYSVDGYSEILRPEFADLGRSQLEEMLKLPDADRQMVQPETPREDIRNLKRFNKEEPVAGEADDLHELIEKFYKDNPDVLDKVSRETFEEENIKHFAEIVNPGGNRSYKKGMFFLMMYENRVAVKKFGEDPRNLTWWEFYKITTDIFKDIEPKQKSLEEKDEHNKESETNLCENNAEEKIEEHPEEKNTEKEIAPAQKSAEILEREVSSEEQNGKNNEARDRRIEEPEMEEKTETKESESGFEAMNEPEVIEKPFGSRKDYIDTLTAYGMAMYIAEEYKRHNLKASSLAFPTELERWLKEEVDENGMSLEQEGATCL